MYIQYIPIYNVYTICDSDCITYIVPVLKSMNTINFTCLITWVNIDRVIN